MAGVGPRWRSPEEHRRRTAPAQAVCACALCAVRLRRRRAAQALCALRLRPPPPAHAPSPPPPGPLRRRWRRRERRGTARHPSTMRNLRLLRTGECRSAAAPGTPQCFCVSAEAGTVLVGSQHGLLELGRAGDSVRAAAGHTGSRALLSLSGSGLWLRGRVPVPVGSRASLQGFGSLVAKLE